MFGHVISHATNSSRKRNKLFRQLNHFTNEIVWRQRFFPSSSSSYDDSNRPLYCFVCATITLFISEQCFYGCLFYQILRSHRMTGRRLNSAVELRVKRPDGGTFRRFSHMVSRNDEISFPPRIVTNSLTFLTVKSRKILWLAHNIPQHSQKFTTRFSGFLNRLLKIFQATRDLKFINDFNAKQFYEELYLQTAKSKLKKNSPLELENVNIINCFTTRQRHDVMCAERWMSSLQRCDETRQNIYVKLNVMCAILFVKETRSSLD